MNEIERFNKPVKTKLDKAIAFAKGYQHRVAQWILRYGEKPENTALDEWKTIVEALREKLERSKGCGYCNDLMMNPKSGLYKALYGYPKRFCLNCGRKLDGGGEG